MRIGILTYHWVCNFGAQLQTLSTYKFLEKQSCNPIIINWIPDDARLIYSRRVGSAQQAMHDGFFQSRLEMTVPFSNPYEFTSIVKQWGITHVVIGSDSLFNIQKARYNFLTRKKRLPTSDHIFPNPFWGYGFEEIPHVALSVSCQNANYKLFAREKQTVGGVLEKFKAITVRDSWTQLLVSYFTNGEIIPDVTPDPVFAFNNNVSFKESRRDFLDRLGLPEKYVLFSFAKGRMQVHQDWLEQIANKFIHEGYECIWLPKVGGGQKAQLEKNIPLPLDPLDWYNAIRYSSAYIGVLMHPIVVCLHNAVPFFSFDHYGIGLPLISKESSSKIYDILKRADLLRYHYFQRNHFSFPSPEKVYRLIMEFPKDKCGVFAQMQQERCLANMSNLLNILTNE